MNQPKLRGGRPARAMRLITAACMGAMFASGCSLTDILTNIMAGTLGFVKGYAESILEALIPPADELLGTAQE